MLNINGMYIQFTKSSFNRATVQEDGITQIIDTEHYYPMYSLQISKPYFDVDSKEEAVKLAIADLKGLIKELEKLQEQEKER